MPRGIDAVLQELPGGLFDIKIGFDGDIETEDTFDTAILVSLFTDARADESQVSQSNLRRGWIGNEFTPDFQIGSLLWLFEQAKLTRTLLNEIEDEARAALQWLVDDGLAVAITNVSAVSTKPGQLVLELTIERTTSVVERRFFELWQNTGIN